MATSTDIPSPSGPVVPRLIGADAECVAKEVVKEKAGEETSLERVTMQLHCEKSSSGSFSARSPRSLRAPSALFGRRRRISRLHGDDLARIRVLDVLHEHGLQEGERRVEHFLLLRVEREEADRAALLHRARRVLEDEREAARRVLERDRLRARCALHY